MVIWQSVGVLAGAITILVLVQKSALPLDVAVSLIVLIGFWALCHFEDGSYWYNRNLAIIANIERQFLNKDDLKRIHYYFGAHRQKNKMILHILIQYILGIGIVSVFLIYHFVTRVAPGFGVPIENFDVIRCLPYALTVILTGVLFYVRKDRRKSYDNFIANSPGDEVDTEGIVYGVGNGHAPEKLDPSVPKPNVPQ